MFVMNELDGHCSDGPLDAVAAAVDGGKDDDCQGRNGCAV